MSSINVPYSKLIAQFLLLSLHNFPSCQPLDTDIGIRFTREPESRVVPPGDRVFFNCRTNTGQDEEIYWLHNGHQLDPSKRSDVRISNGQLSIKIRTAKRH
ncbi:uncharacterized protein LOC111717658, partial [Eurytemora carolleeae]|uniref:uncharacterized protein LOC111717658 n=1 Tax=Eurytemora carolleeae TaxID=1294199 RepID=UPI000C778A81